MGSERNDNDGNNPHGVAPTGRPTKLSVAVMKAICKAIALGAPYLLAARVGGIVYTTFREWMIWGERDLAEDKDTPYHAFYLAVREAENLFVMRALERVEVAAAKGEWTANAWLLERRYPEHFALKGRLEVTGAGGGPIQHVHLDVDLKAILADPVTAEAYARIEQKIHGQKKEPTNGSGNGHAPEAGVEPAQ